MIVLFLGGPYDGQCMDVPETPQGAPALRQYQVTQYQHTAMLSGLKKATMPEVGIFLYNLISLMDTDGSYVHVYQCESEKPRPAIRTLVEGYRRASD